MYFGLYLGRFVFLGDDFWLASLVVRNMADGATAEATITLEAIYKQNTPEKIQFTRKSLESKGKNRRESSQIVENVNSVVNTQEVLNTLFENQKKELHKYKVTNDNLLKRDTQSRCDLEKATKQINSFQSTLEKAQQNINDLQ